MRIWTICRRSGRGGLLSMASRRSLRLIKKTSTVRRAYLTTGKWRIIWREMSAKWKKEWMSWSNVTRAKIPCSKNPRDVRRRKKASTQPRQFSTRSISAPSNRRTRTNYSKTPAAGSEKTKCSLAWAKTRWSSQHKPSTRLRTQTTTLWWAISAPLLSALTWELPCSHWTR